jgi:hypothetical protein
MNNTFSIQRFSLLLKRQWLEFGKIYLISLVVVLGIFLCFYGFNYYSITNFKGHAAFSYRVLFFRVPLFIVMGLLFTSVIASSYFAHLGQKPRAIIDLMIPASTFEKFMGSIFFTSVLGIGSYLLLFYLTDLAFVVKLRGWYESSGNPMLLNGQKVALNEIFPLLFVRQDASSFIPVYIFPFFLTSIFLLGSIYFERFHYIKTAIVVMIFSGIWFAIIMKSGKLLFEGRIPIDNDQMKHMFSDRNTAEYLITILVVLLTLILWSITYVRLKEKEV